MLNKEDILALAWEFSEGSGKCYTFTEESLFEFLNELKKGQAPQPEQSGLVKALEECAASLAWNCFGECRAIHDGPIMPAAQALETAREALATHRAQGDNE